MYRCLLFFSFPLLSLRNYCVLCIFVMSDIIRYILLYHHHSVGLLTVTVFLYSFISTIIDISMEFGRRNESEMRSEINHSDKSS